MTSDRPFEQELSGLLTELAYGPPPDYRDDIVQQAARTRQRPAWMFPERWLPVTPVTSRVAVSPRVPWRLIALAALLIAGLAIGATLIAGSRHRLPAPFGEAGNGGVAYAVGGHIYVADHTTGAATAVTNGADWDVRPVWSDDGTRLVFERKNNGGDSAPFGSLVVVNADGSHPTMITPKPLQQLADYAFSPDGSEVVFTTGPDDGRSLGLARTDGSGVQELAGASGAVSPVFLAPSGLEIVFATTASPEVGTAISAVNTLTGAVRAIVAPTAGLIIDWIRSSPDGSRIAYSAHTDDPGRNTYQVHVVGADGTGGRILPMPAGATFQDAPEWSNDGKSIALTRGYLQHNEDMVLAVVPADGSGTGVQTAHKVTGCCDTTLQWSPDDSAVLVLPENLDGVAAQQQLLNPLSGALTSAPWLSNSQPSWQRTSR